MIARLYLISPERIDDPTLFADALRTALDGGDVAAFQLFLPHADDSVIARAADTLRPVCQQRDVAFILGGRPDLAVKLDCDGVQVGIDDYADARRLVGQDRQVGVFAPPSRHLAMDVAEAGADYVAFDAHETELIEWWSAVFEVPCVAAGDITPASAAPLLKAGADFIAVSAAVWEAPEGPQAAVRAFNEMFSANG